MDIETVDLTPLEQIELQAERADEARTTLRNATAELKLQIDAIRADAIEGLRVAVRQFRERAHNLAELVKSHPEVFVRPKSRCVHGWKFGYRKKPGRIDVKDEAKTMDLIRKHLPELADLLIAKRESVAKDALNQLSVQQLKRIGVSVIDDSDQPFLTPVGDDVAALVDTLLGPEFVEALQA